MLTDNVETRDVLQRLLKTLMINFDDVFTQDKIKIIVGKDTGTL